MQQPRRILSNKMSDSQATGRADSKLMISSPEQKDKIQRLLLNQRRLA